MKNHTGFEVLLSDAEIVEIVMAFDRQSLPLERRMEGDDDAIRTLSNRLGVEPLSVNMVLLVSCVLREAVHRGLNIQKGN